MKLGGYIRKFSSADLITINALFGDTTASRNSYTPSDNALPTAKMRVLMGVNKCLSKIVHLAVLS